MDIETLHQYAISLGQIEDCQPFGPDNIVYKTKNKMFLLVALNANPISINVKCNPELAIELREKYNSILSGYHMNKKHWNTITIDTTLTQKQLKQFIKHSFDLVNGLKL